MNSIIEKVFLIYWFTMMCSSASLWQFWTYWVHKLLHYLSKTRRCFSVSSWYFVLGDLWCCRRDFLICKDSQYHLKHDLILYSWFKKTRDFASFLILHYLSVHYTMFVGIFLASSKEAIFCIFAVFLRAKPTTEVLLFNYLV